MIALHNESLFSAMSEEDLVPDNRRLLSGLMSGMEPFDSGTVPQPVVVIGGTGSGKTFLLKKLAAELNAAKDYFPVLIEGKTLFSNSDLFGMCSEKLGIGGDSDGFGTILSWQTANRKRAVILVDNIQYYFKRTDNTEQYALRGYISNTQAPIIIGTADSVIPQFADYKAAFFDGLKLHYIKPLSDENAMFLLSCDDKDRAMALFGLMPRTVRSLKISERIVKNSQKQENDLQYLTDMYSAYYQAKYDGCLMQEQRILSAVSSSAQGMPLRTIRELTGQDNAKISPYLGEMTEKGMLATTGLSPRKTIYAVKDSLFREWLVSLNGK